jgi:6-phosphogluconolactonase/glucosamine-6-phosphate isomerase/deaminase
MTLTLPAINRARRIVWLEAGYGKARALQRLIDGDTRIPPGRVRRDAASILADRGVALEINLKV